MKYKIENDASLGVHHLLFSSFTVQFVRVFPSREEFDRGIGGRGMEESQHLEIIPLPVPGLPKALVAPFPS